RGRASPPPLLFLFRPEACRRRRASRGWRIGGAVENATGRLSPAAQALSLDSEGCSDLQESANVANIVFLNPRFDPSFWALDRPWPVLGKKAAFPVASLPLLAALTPAEHTVTLMDENVEPINYDALMKADIIGLTGMIVQRARMAEILTELKRRGKFVVVGGPWVTVQEDYFGDLPDVIFVGEAEEAWPQFLSDWKQGRYRRRYEQAEKTDMTRVPAPRLDLLKMSRYLFGSVQLSRGCPFQCEFC